MNVLLINPNRLRPRVPPIGLDYLYESLVLRGHTVSLYDFSVQPPGDLKRHIRENAPDIVGISVRNLDDVTVTRKQEFVTPLKKLVHSIRRMTDAKIVLGGIGFSFMPYEFMVETGADFGITGDGEKAFAALLDNLDSPEAVPNLFYHKAGNENRIERTRACMSDVDEMPPSRRSLIDYEPYNLSGSAGNVQTKRGCDRQCLFCPEPHVSGRTVRVRPMESVIEELKILSGYGFGDRIFIVDSEFNVRPDHAYATAKAVLDSGLKIRWLCYMTPKGADRELLSIMKKAGCAIVIWSLEAASEKMLVRLKKDFGVRDIFKVSEDCDRVGLPYYHALLFGGPGEDTKTIDETYRNISKTRAAIIGVNAGIRIYPGAGMFDVAMAEGEISDTVNLLYPVYYREKMVKTVFLPYIKKKFADLGNVAMHGLPLDKKYHETLEPFFFVIR